MSKDSGVILNFDFLSFVSTRYHMGIDVEKSDILDFVDQYKGTQVTDCCVNINASLSYTPSRVMETCFDKFLEMKKVYEENPQGINYIADISRKHLETAYRIYKEKSLDLHEIMF